jgi:small conductance mechanosensitive channel
MFGFSSLVAVVAIAVASVVVFELIMRWLRKIIMIKGNVQVAARLINIFRIIFYAFIVIVELGVLGINLVAILAGAGFLGIIVGLAVQQPLGNFFSGVYVIVSRIVRRGDVISVNAIGSNITTDGTVSHIGFSHTVLIDKNGKLILVPNNVIISSILIRKNRIKGHW